ncbi:MAG: TetR/AcrR family transcriptional regulator [Bacilli bacterium]|nr:TetR/AcrR family transcriptional regulator [Bacilli bacterium]MBR2711018.1 TetR/AcrR family transcriptional regulator [Bacilli bacterium]
MELQSDRSKKDIADALISLMKKKDFNKITNKDITNRAGLSHITIYRNFNNKDEIVKYYLDELTDEFIKTSKILFDPNDFTNYLIKLFTHLEKNKDIGILLYKANMIHHLKDEFDRIFLNKANSLNEEFTYSFISGGLYNIYYYWIKNGCKESPQELAEMFKDFYILKGK